MKNFSRLISAALLWCVACSSPVAAAEPTLADFARSQVGREAFGLYLAGQKAGWMVIDTHLARHDGQEALEAVDDMHIVMQFLGVEAKTELHSVTRHALDGAGELLYAEASETEDDRTIQRIAERDGNELRIRTTENGATSDRRSPLPRDTLTVARNLEAWLAKPPQPGERFTTYELTLDGDAIDEALETEFVESTRLVWGGVPMTAHRIKTVWDGAKGEMLVAGDGRMLRGKLGMILEVRAEEESVAKTLGGEPVDMLAASAIHVDQPLGDGADINRLTLQLSGLADFQLPQSPRQQVTQRGDGMAELVLTREQPVDAGTALSDASREASLQATPAVQSDAESIRTLAAQIIGDETDAVRRASLIVDWIGKNLEQSYAANASTATAVLEQRSGDCTEHALLFTALARAAGVPARQIGGVVYVDDPSPLFAWHAWAEIHDGRAWVSVDPMWQQVRINPTHIQFSVDSEADAAWINVLGAVKVEVKDVQRQ